MQNTQTTPRRQSDDHANLDRRGSTDHPASRAPTTRHGKPTSTRR